VLLLLAQLLLLLYR